MGRQTLSSGSLLFLVVCSLVSAAAADGVGDGAGGTWHDGKAGLTITVPAGWHVSTRSLTGITQPVQRFVVYSGSLPRRPVSVARPSATQALAIVMEQTSVSPDDLEQFPLRPRTFTVAHLGGMESFQGDRWAERVFRESGRAFYAFVWVGARDSRELPTMVTALSSLRVG